MTIKVTYNVTDVYMSQSVSPVYINVSYSDGGASGGGVWGTITGTLSNQTDLQSALDLKVPYSGATGNVNLGEYELKAGQVTLDTSPTGTAAVGTIRWNDTTGTSETTLKGGNVIIKNGVDLVARVVNKVIPNTTLTKAAYQAVRVSGAQGQRLAIELAQANNDAGSADTIGLVTETIAPNQEGFIMTVGQLEGINTTGSLQGETWVDGDVLYLSPTTAGAITNVKPTGATGHLVIIGYVEYAHVNNGKIYVKVMNGWELDELHNVSIVTPANNQGLFYNSSNSLWENKTISTALGYTPVPTTRNITINGVTYDLSADRTYTISTGISGSGASGQVTYWTGASAVSGSNNLFWDNTNGRLGIGTNVPASPLHIVGNSLITGQSTFGGNMTISLNHNQTTKLTITNTQSGSISEASLILTSDATAGVGVLSKYSNTTGAYKTVSAADTLLYNGTKGDISILNDFATGRIKFASGGGSTPQMTLFANGNLAINSGVTDLGVRFGVVGDTLLRGSGNTSATTALTVQNSDSNPIFYVENNGGTYVRGRGANNVFFVQSSAGANLLYVQNVGVIGFTAYTWVPESSTASVIFDASISRAWTIAGNAKTATSGVSAPFLVTTGYAPTSGTGVYNALTINPTINQTGGANGITRGLYVNPTLTSAADWRSIEWSNNTGWGLYGAGTANNYLAGRLGLGSTSLTNTIIRVGNNITGATSHFSVFASQTVLSDVANASIFTTEISTQATAFTLNTLRHYRATKGTFGASSIVANQYGFFAESTLTDATNNYGFWGDIAAGTGRWNLYMNGTADNYLAGNLGIGITPTVRLQVSGDTILRGSGATSATTALTVQNSSSTNLFTVRNDGLVSLSSALTNSLNVVSSALNTRITIDNTNASPNTGFNLSYSGVIKWALATYGANADFTFYNNATATDSLFIAGNTNNIGIRTNAPTARLDIPASVTTAASLRIRSGTAPTSPNDGDIWFDGTDIKMRIGGVTKTFTLL